MQLDDLAWKSYDEEALKQLFVELEFDGLGKRLFGKSFSAAATRTAVIREKREKEIQQTLFDEPVEERTIRDAEHTYTVVDTPQARAELLEQLLSRRPFVLTRKRRG